MVILLLAGAAGGWIWLRAGTPPPPLPTLAPTSWPGGVAVAATSLAPTGTPQLPTPTDTATSTAAPTASPTATLMPTATPTETALPPDFVPSPTPWPRPSLRPVPGEPVTYLDTFRLIAYYGSPQGPSLGVLGAAPREQTLRQLRQLAGHYQALAPERYALPTFHIITTVADPIPGKDGDYNHWLDRSLLEEWLAAAAAAEVAVVLDIQPGYADLLAEFERLRPYLGAPHVHLALDPEFTMEGGAIPGYAIGRLYGEQINLIQAELEGIALKHGVNKVMIVHQFDTGMVLDKEDIIDYPHVELVIDADGFGPPQGKSGDYVQYAAEPGFEYGGFKLFYEWDYPLMAPADVMALDPPPAVVIYQ